MKHAVKALFSSINVFNKMKNLIALLVFFLIQVFQMPCENVLNTIGIYTLLPDEFAKAALTYETPSTNESDYDIKSCHREQVDLWHKYDLQVMEKICKEAQKRGEELNNTVVEYGEELLTEIKAKTINATKVIAALNKLKGQLKLFLNLKPGNVAIKQSTLPPLKPAVSFSVNKTAAECTDEELFVTLPIFLHEHYLSLLYLMQSIYYKGWEAIWPRYDKVLTVFRDKILNGLLLVTYALIVERTYEHEETISKIVGEDEWDDFGWYGDEILDIHDECYKLKDE